MIRPFQPSPTDRYGRLFPPASEAITQQMEPPKLEAVSHSLRRETALPFPLLISHKPLLAGLTYFGQFIDHDLTFDLTPFSEAGKLEPRETINYRTPWLDLDHVYGDGPGSLAHGHLYEADNVRFRVGRRGEVEPFDVPVDEKGRALVADARNAENVMIRQIHAMFLKLHNLAAGDLPSRLEARERFTQARRRVQWQYQWLVRSWFLAKICEQSVYERIVEEGRHGIDWQTDGFSIPVEFSLAAMRYGHSMVRDAYELNGISQRAGGRGEIPLRELFGVNNRGPLPPELKIDWPLFLKGEKSRAMAIDTAIVEPLFHLPPDEDHVYGVSPAVPPPRLLSFRTLVRGAAARLPTAQQVREVFGIQISARMTNPDPAYTEDPWGPLRAAGLAEATPLFYYILLEAELDRVGQGLGALGSTLVAEVIEGSLRMDNDSFLNVKPTGWTPEPWIGSDGKPIKITSLLELAEVVRV